jgi:hypothetical protein
MLYQYVKYLLHSQENLLKDYQIGPWFEAFTFIKKRHREKPPREMPELHEASKQ